MQFYEWQKVNSAISIMKFCSVKCGHLFISIRIEFKEVLKKRYKKNGALAGKQTATVIFFKKNCSTMIHICEL